MRNNYISKDRAFAEAYTLLLIAYENYTRKAITRSEYELRKRTYLYDKFFLKQIIENTRLDEITFADPFKSAADLLEELFEDGVITEYEYENQKKKFVYF